jgi:hypothetical protein
MVDRTDGSTESPRWVLALAPPQRIAHIAGEVSSEWVDAGRADELEDMTPEQSVEFWGEVRRRLEAWPEEGP